MEKANFVRLSEPPKVILVQTYMLHCLTYLYTVNIFNWIKTSTLREFLLLNFIS